MRAISSCLFTAAAALLLAACANSPATSSATGASVAATAAATAGNVLRATLPNGLKVVIVRDAFAPVATQQITYFVGANEAPRGFPGTAHAQEHMMFRGSPGLSGNQLSAIYARMGGDLDAFTTNSITSYYFTVPSGDIDIALHIGALRMAGVDDSEAQWQKERGAIEQEVARDHSSPLYTLYEKLLRDMFAGTPYAHTALGTKPSFDETTGAMLKRFHDTWYAPNNALLVVTGDVDPPAVLAKIKILYGSIPSKKLPAKPAIKFQPVKAATFDTASDQPYGVILVAFRMPGYRSPDYPAAELASDALGSQRGPIAALRYAGKVLASGFQMQPMPDTSVAFAYAVYPPGADVATVKQALAGAIEQVRSEGAALDLIAAAKRRALLHGQLQRNSVAGLANVWTSAIALAGLESPAEALTRLRQVTPAEVDTQIRSGLDLDHAITLVANPTPGTQPTGGSGYGGAESFGSQPSGKVTLPAWAAGALAKLPHPKPFLHPADMTLANGLRLVVQPLGISDSVSVYGSVNENEDMQAPAGEEGVSDLLADLFDWGPQGMTRLQYDAAQDEIGAELSVGPDFSLQVLPQDFDAGMKLLASDLLRPSLPADAFAQQQAIQARQAQGQLESPVFKFQLAIDRALYPQGDPALRLATGQSIMSLTPAKLEAYYQSVYRPDETTIVVIGDITPDQAKATVEKYFGSWTAHGPKPRTDYPPVPPSKASKVFVADPVRTQNRVALAETLDLNYTNPSHFALDLANDLLSGGFYASPLYKELREKRGLVYTMSSNFGFERYRSDYTLQFGAYPDKVAEARDLAIKVLGDAAAKPFSQNQLLLAKSIGLRQIELGNESVDAIGQNWLGLSQRGLPLDWDYVMARHFEQLTAPEVQQALQKYFDPARLSTIVLGKPVKQ